MDRGIYTALTGGVQSARRLDVTANNLANVNTVGFKAQRLQHRQQEFEDTLASKMNAPRAAQDHERTPGVVTIASATDFTPGPVSTTGNPLNVALGKPNQFFTVETPEGEMLTRAGNFTLDAEGNLVSQDGHPVLGDGGPLTLPQGSARIAQNGDVIVEGETIGKVRVVELTPEQLQTLERKDGTRFTITGAAPTPAENAELVTESVEMANVSVVEAMIEMINAQKAFETYTKTARTIDELNERSIRNARLSG